MVRRLYRRGNGSGQPEPDSGLLDAHQKVIRKAFLQARHNGWTDCVHAIREGVFELTKEGIEVNLIHITLILDVAEKPDLIKGVKRG